MSETDVTPSRIPSARLCEQAAKTGLTTEFEHIARLNGLLDVLADLIAEEIISETRSQNEGTDHDSQSTVSN